MEMVGYVGKKNHSMVPHSALGGRCWRNSSTSGGYNRETRETRRCFQPFSFSQGYQRPPNSRAVIKADCWVGCLWFKHLQLLTFLDSDDSGQMETSNTSQLLLQKGETNAKNNNGDNNSVTTLNLLNMTWTRANVGRLRASTSCSL